MDQDIQEKAKELLEEMKELSRRVEERKQRILDELDVDGLDNER
jgi:hypothetical protein